MNKQITVQRDSRMLRGSITGGATCRPNPTVPAGDCEREDEYVATCRPPALQGGAADGYNQAGDDLVQATEREMQAAWALRQYGAELSTLLGAIWPGPVERDVTSGVAGPDRFFPPAVLSAMLDELQARCRHAGTIWEEEQCRKGAAIERFLSERAATFVTAGGVQKNQKA